MGLKVRVVYKYIIEKNDDKFAQMGMEDVVYGCLEGGWGVSEAERRHEELVMAIVGAKICFVGI